MNGKIIHLTSMGTACIILLLLNNITYGASVVVGGDHTDIGTIIFVSPQPGDSTISNGTALLNTLSGISDMSPENPYLIRLGPGTYDLGATGLQMKQFVSIEGSGEKATKITGAISSTTWPPTVAAVMGADNAELRFLTVENTGTETYTIAIANLSSSPSIIHVAATASGGVYRYGVYNNSSTPTMTYVTAISSGGTYSYGVGNYSSSPIMTDVTATGSGGTTDTIGVYNISSSSPTMTNVTATGSGGTNCYGVGNNSSSPTMTNVTATGSGGTYCYGVFNYSSSPIMTNVTATGSVGTNCYGVGNDTSSSPAMVNVISTASGGSYNYGVYNNSSSPNMTNVIATALGGTNSYGIFNSAPSGSYTILIDHCSVAGNTGSINNSQYFSLMIGASKLAGPINSGTGTWTCVGSYNGSYGTLGASCL